MLDSPPVDQADETTSKGQMPKGLAAAIASTALAVPFAFSFATTPKPAHPRVFFWYRSLPMPDFKPPDVVVPFVWTGIEAAMSYGAFRLLRMRGSSARNAALAWLALNVVSIGAWSQLFFGRRNLPASTAAAAVMVGTGAAYVVEANKVDRKAAVAGVPFVAWVAFATVLTAAIWRRNR